MKNGKVTILFIITLLDRMGGAEKNLYDVVTNLDRSRFSPSVVTFKGGKVSEQLSKAGIKVRVISVTKIFSYKALKPLIALHTYLQKHKPDIVVTYHHDADILGGFLAWLVKVPKIISSRRDMGYQLQTKHIWFYRLGGCLFNEYIVVSQAVKDAIVKREWVAPEKVVVIHNGLNVNEFKSDTRARIEHRASFLVKSNEVLVGCVASFRPIKGQEFLVDALAEMLEFFSKLKVLFIGYYDTKYGQKVREKIVSRGLQNHFIFAGMREDVPSLLNALDLFVVPSVNEGFSNAIVEAMASGLPVVAARSGGNSESVIDGKTGLLFESKNSHDLAEKLLYLCNNKLTKREMGARGLVRARERFQLQNMVEMYAGVFKN